LLQEDLGKSGVCLAGRTLIIMLDSTGAYAKYKRQTEQLLDFAVMICYAAPHLSRAIVDAQGRATEAIGPPDHFRQNATSVDALRGRLTTYQPQLAAHIALSSFSFFEAFIKDAVLEMLAWHGGAAGWKTRVDAFTRTLPAEMLAHKRKLQETPKKGHAHRYRKHSKALNAAGFKYPSSLLSSYAAALLEERVSRDALRASEIPDLLIKGLHMAEADVNPSRFGEIRAKRNQIAHGKAGPLTLAAALKIAKELHTLAAKVDFHLREHFFVIEEYSVG
jgi:hypothetical protein